MGGIIDILLLVVFGVVTWCIASEGAWGAVLMCLCVLFSGLLAMNYFEPLANYLQATVASSPSWKLRWDLITLVGLFALFVVGLRSACEYLLPEFVPVHPLLNEVARWSAAALTGYIAMAFLLTALHTAYLPREFIGFTPERNNFFGIVAPDRQWLGFTQYVSERPFRKRRPRIFDGPQFTAGSHTDEIWPSFPIRYAARRAAGPRGAAAGGRPSGGMKGLGRQ